MLKLYTHLYAWAYLRHERQWGSGYDHAWTALINVSMLVFLNVGALVPILCYAFHFDIGTFLQESGRNVGLAVVVGIPLLVWGSVQRTGLGLRLVERLRKSSDAEKRSMERKLIAYLVGSFVAFALSCIGFALLKFPIR